MDAVTQRGPETAPGDAAGETSSDAGADAPVCPVSVAPPQACGAGDSVCSTATGCCRCVEMGFCGRIWACKQLAVEQPGCPPSPPAQGSACTGNRLICNYCGPAGYIALECASGSWIDSAPICI
jgi:hypothetical protein